MPWTSRTGRDATQRLASAISNSLSAGGEGFVMSATACSNTGPPRRGGRGRRGADEQKVASQRGASSCSFSRRPRARETPKVPAARPGVVANPFHPWPFMAFFNGGDPKYLLMILQLPFSSYQKEGDF